MMEISYPVRRQDSSRFSSHGSGLRMPFIGDCSGGGMSCDQRPLAVHVDLDDIGPEEQGDRPVGDDPHTAVPARSDEQVIASSHPPRGKSPQANAHDPAKADEMAK